jgi:hypothetical protein
MPMRLSIAVLLSLAALGGGVEIALAQTTPPAPAPTVSARDGGMMPGGMMKGGQGMESGMMSRMMGEDPASACDAMMQAVLRDPAAHRAMNDAMRRAFSAQSPAPAATHSPR